LVRSDWVSRDAVARSGDGFDYVGVAEFAAQPPDGDLNRFGEGIGVFVPDPFEEVFGAEGGGRGSQEKS